VDPLRTPEFSHIALGGIPRSRSVSDQHDNNIDLEPAPAASLASMQRLAKSAAVASLEKRLLADEKVSEPVARTIARAVVDPADARNRLDRLTHIRVPGGIIYALETTVWATAVVPYLVNNREASDRHFPAGVKIGSTEAARYKPLRPPTDPGDGTARLEIVAGGKEHLIWSLERSAKFLLEHNNWTESIAAQGVMQHVTLAAVDVLFHDEEPTVTMLGSVDGSSRVNSAHAVLGITPHDVLYGYAGDERFHRQVIANLLANLERPVDSVAAEDVGKLRALEIPARIFLKFEPDPVTPISFSKAVESFVHLVHVEPAKPWDSAASLDAKADSVLNELLNEGEVTPKRKAYYEGMLTPEEAKAAKFPHHLDERALEIIALISSEKTGTRRAIRSGILLLSKGGNIVKKELKTEVAVELALRGFRSNMTRKDAEGARETLQNVYLHPDIWGRGLKPTRRTPEELRDAALEELKAGDPGEGCLRIAAQGAYWLAAQRLLREARFFDTDQNLRDGRTPQRVLNDLMRTPRGIQFLYRAIVDGRDQVAIVQVNETGTRQKGVSGKILEATHAWVRRDVAPQEQPGGAAQVGGTGGPGGTSTNGGPTLPDRMLLIELGKFKRAVDHLEDAHAELRKVKDASGTILVDQDGIANDTVDDLRERLETLRTSLAWYGSTWKHKNAIESDDDTAIESDDDTAIEMPEVES
jgi:hypothetical protein